MKWDTTGTRVVRSAGPSDAAFLRSMLYEALYVHDGHDPLPLSVLDEPEVHRYVVEFGKWAGDLGVIGIDRGEPIGGCWLRLFSSDDPGYGWVGADVPELSIAVAARARNQGLGALLVESVLEEAKGQGVERVSLSVDPRSPALRLYERLGFHPVGSQGTSVTMFRYL